MTIHYKKLIGLPVETKSGLLLGKIKNFEVETETQQIARYTVKTRNLIDNLLSEKTSELVIGRAEVVSLGEEKMVVEDAVAGEAEKARVTEPIGKDAPVLPSKLSIAKTNDRP